MSKSRISQGALKVAIGLVTLSTKEGWAQRLPQGLAEMSERLLLASGAWGYGPRLMRWARRPWMRRVWEIQDRLVPGQFEGFGHRKIFMQEQVQQAIDAGARQVLVLGAGFDTLCLRLAPEQADVRFFEVDAPATSEAKARGVSAEGRPENLTLIAADLGEQPLSKVLAEEGQWDASQPSVVTAEGLFLYLTDEDVHNLMRETAAAVPPGSRLVFSHMIPRKHRAVSLMMRLVGEPFRSTVASEDLAEYIDGTGWVLISGVDTDPAHGIERYAVAEHS